MHTNLDMIQTALMNMRVAHTLAGTLTTEFSLTEESSPFKSLPQ